jgi:hypothetical protein
MLVYRQLAYDDEESSSICNGCLDYPWVHVVGSCLGGVRKSIRFWGGLRKPLAQMQWGSDSASQIRKNIDRIYTSNDIWIVRYFRLFSNNLGVFSV